MSGSRAGGLKTAITMKQRYGLHVYERIGAMGGKVSKGGFFSDPAMASKFGKIGGANGKRGKAYDPAA